MKVIILSGLVVSTHTGHPPERCSGAGYVQAGTDASGLTKNELKCWKYVNDVTFINNYVRQTLLQLLTFVRR